MEVVGNRKRGRPRTGHARGKQLVTRLGSDEWADMEWLQKYDPQCRPMATLCRDVMMALAKQLRKRDEGASVKVEALEAELAESPGLSLDPRFVVKHEKLQRAKADRLYAAHRTLVDMELLPVAVVVIEGVGGSIDD